MSILYYSYPQLPLDKHLFSDILFKRMAEEKNDNIEEVVLEGPKSEEEPKVEPVKKRNVDITPAQRKYFLNRAAGMNKKDAALDAGYTLATSRNVKENIEKSEGFIKLLEGENKDGLTDELLVQEHTKLVKQDDDKSVKGKMIVEAYKLKGKYPKGEFDGDAPNVTLHFKKREGE